MTSMLSAPVPELITASPEMIAKLDAINLEILKYDQVPIATAHMIHGQMYVRTIRLKADTVMMGSIVKRPTVLILNGSCSVLNGEGVLELEGYNVIPGRAGRKQLFYCRTAVEMTMLFPTQAKTVEEAEDEVFAESDQLMSRRDATGDTVVLTGE